MLQITKYLQKSRTFDPFKNAFILKRIHKDWNVDNCSKYACQNDSVRLHNSGKMEIRVFNRRRL